MIHTRETENPQVMENRKTFVNRRKGSDRRYDLDPCREIPLDLYHRKRRKSTDRRSGRSLVEDYYAFTKDDTNVQSPN